MKTVIIHHHIFKNAGTTVDWVLKKNFGDDAVQYDQAGPQYLSEQDILRVLGGHPNCRSFSSHQSHVQRIHAADYRFIDIAFVRHPIDRLRSVYDFYQSSPQLTTPFAEFAHSRSLRDFICEVALGTFEALTCNVQTWIFATGFAIPWHAPTEDELAAAKQRAREVQCLGLVERFDESMALAETVLAQASIAVDFRYRVMNQSSRRQPRLDDRLGALAQLVGDAIYSQLIDRNYLDLELWEFAGAEVSRRLANFRSIDQRIERISGRAEA